MTPNASQSTRILFIGNSYTTRNQLPRLLVDLAATAEQPTQVEVATIFAGGASLRRHWNAGNAQKALTDTRWDYVVLQEQSTLPVKNPQRYHENVRLFVAEIAKHGAKIALYLTWSRQQAPQTQDQITRAVEDIAAEIGARVDPWVRRGTRRCARTRAWSCTKTMAAIRLRPDRILRRACFSSASSVNGPADGRCPIV